MDALLVKYMIAIGICATDIGKFRNTHANVTPAFYCGEGAEKKGPEKRGREM